VWLWTSAVGATPADVDRWWQAFLRGSDSRLNVRCQLRRFGLVRPGGRAYAGSRCGEQAVVEFGGEGVDLAGDLGVRLQLGFLLDESWSALAC
jgi:hypothetical protein